MGGEDKWTRDEKPTCFFNVTNFLQTVKWIKNMAVSQL